MLRILCMTTGLLALQPSTSFAKSRIGASLVGYSKVTLSHDESGTEYSESTSSIGGFPGVVVGFTASPNIELGATLAVTSTEAEQAVSYGDGVQATSKVKAHSVEALTYLDYNFNPESTSVFAIGPRVGLLNQKTGDLPDTKGLSYGIAGGLKHFVSESASIDLKAQYLLGTLKHADLEVELTGISIAAGISIWL